MAFKGKKYFTEFERRRAAALERQMNHMRVHSGGGVVFKQGIVKMSERNLRDYMNNMYSAGEIDFRNELREKMKL